MTGGSYDNELIRLLSFEIILQQTQGLVSSYKCSILSIMKTWHRYSDTSGWVCSLPQSMCSLITCALRIVEQAAQTELYIFGQITQGIWQCCVVHKFFSSSLNMTRHTNNTVKHRCRAVWQDSIPITATLFLLYIVTKTI